MSKIVHEPTDDQLYKGGMYTADVDGIVVGIVQLARKPKDPRYNAELGIKTINEAQAVGVNLLVFPEMWTPGYLIGDTFEDEAFIHDLWRQDAKMVTATAGSDIAVAHGTVIRDRPDAKGEDGRMRKINGGIVYQDGKILNCNNGESFFAKTNIPKYRMFQEIRHMTSAQILAREAGINIDDYLNVYEIEITGKVRRVGFIVCEDAWQKDYLIKVAEILAALGIDILVILNDSPWGWQKNRARHSQFGGYLSRLGIVAVYANGVGAQDNGKAIYPFDGASTVYNQRGKVAAMAKPFEEELLVVPLSNDMSEITVPTLSDMEESFLAQKQGWGRHLSLMPPGMRTLYIGASGGVDSEVNATMGTLMLGADNVVCVNMPHERINGQASIKRARIGAERRGNAFLMRPITAMADMLAEDEGFSLDSGAGETTMSTARMLRLRAIASANHGWFSCNGNKPEIGLGYYCKEGDGSGALAPLGDMYKGEVRLMAYFMNTEVLQREVIDWSLITNETPATAELKSGAVPDPLDYGYVTREGEYVRGYHDMLLKAFIEFRKNPEWVLEQYMQSESGLEKQWLLPNGRINQLLPSPTEFVSDLERWWNQFDGVAKWKRHQLPTIIAMSKRPFGFDYHESLGPVYYTDRYLELKSQLLGV